MLSRNKNSFLKTSSYLVSFVLRNDFWHRETANLCRAPRIFITQGLVPHREKSTGSCIGGAWRAAGGMSGWWEIASMG
jgi:hypothetical protein